MRLPDSKSGHPRTRFRNFSHVSEFSSGLETSNKSHKKRDKIEEFLEKKRERNTSRRLFGRNGTWVLFLLLFIAPSQQETKEKQIKSIVVVWLLLDVRRTMPTNRATAQTRKKRSQKKSTTKSKSKSKQPLSETNKNIKPVIKTKIRESSIFRSKKNHRCFCFSSHAIWFELIDSREYLVSAMGEYFTRSDIGQ